MINPNEPAFPVSGIDNPKLMGLTKREYLLSLAIQGAMACPTYKHHKDMIDDAVDTVDLLIEKLNENEG